MAHFDVFRANMAGAFHMSQLTAALLDQPYIPRRLGQMGLFQVSGIRTTSASIERQANTIALVPTTPRGGPAVQNKKDYRRLFNFESVRIAQEDAITADEVQNIRSFGSETEMQSVQAEVNQRNARMSNNMEVTLEWQRIGALKGQVLDADGSVLIDMYEDFGVVAQTEVDFELDAGSPASGVLRTACSNVIRLIEDELDGLPYDGIHCMASSQFFDAFVAHPEYRAVYLATPNAQALSGRTARRTAEFGGITFEEYRGRIGNTKYVADNKAHFFPIGVPDLFLNYFAPAEWWDTVNTIGLPRYARIFPDPMDPNSRVLSRVQCHPIMLNTRPRTVVPAKLT